MESVQQYDALKSEQHIMSRFALLEARAHGAKFSVGAHRIDSDSPEVDRGFDMEQSALESWSESGGIGNGNMSSADMHAARKRWKAVAQPPSIQGEEWSGGDDYVKRWKNGIWPNYEPQLSSNEPAVQVENEEPATIKDWKEENPTSSVSMYSG